MQKESSTYPPFFRQLKNQPNTNNAHFLEDLQKSTHPSHFSGKKLRQKKSRTNITHNFLTSCVFKKSCRSKLMVRIRAVAHELQSCSTSSFRSGEVANPAIRGAKAKGANKNGSFFEVWEVFFFEKTFFKAKNTCHRRPSYCKMLNLEPRQKYCYNVRNFMFWYTNFSIVDVRAKLCQHVWQQHVFYGSLPSILGATGAENNKFARACCVVKAPTATAMISEDENGKESEKYNTNI